MTRIGLLSDTHSYLDERVFRYFESCDEIWHAGDIGNLEVADRLEAFRPLRAVYGNIDDAAARRRYPENLRFTVEQTEILMTHIGGKPYAYSKNIVPELEKRLPRVFVCGHSHILRVEFDKKRQMLYMNPGAAGIYGFHKVKTLLRFTIDGSALRDMEAIELGPRIEKLK